MVNRFVIVSVIQHVAVTAHRLIGIDVVGVGPVNLRPVTPKLVTSDSYAIPFRSLAACSSDAVVESYSVSVSACFTSLPGWVISPELSISRIIRSVYRKFARTVTIYAKAVTTEARTVTRAESLAATAMTILSGVSSPYHNSNYTLSKGISLVPRGVC
jgi:hypothetical protein